MHQTAQLLLNRVGVEGYNQYCLTNCRNDPLGTLFDFDLLKLFLVHVRNVEGVPIFIFIFT